MWCKARSWAVNTDSEFGAFNLKVVTVPSLCYNNKLTQPNSRWDPGDAASPGSLQLSSCSSLCLWMKWWTDCCDQLFPGFKTPRLWVAQQCRLLTPPPTSLRGRHISASFSNSRRDGNKCTLRGGKSADQIRPPICWPLSKTVDQDAKRTCKLVAWCSV